MTAKHGSVEVLELLLPLFEGDKEDINARDERGRTPLDYALKGYRLEEMVPLLLKAGARFKENKTTRKMLLHAHKHGDDEWVKMMLENGVEGIKKEEYEKCENEREESDWGRSTFSILMKTVMMAMVTGIITIKTIIISTIMVTIIMITITMEIAIQKEYVSLSFLLIAYIDCNFRYFGRHELPLFFIWLYCIEKSVSLPYCYLFLLSFYYNNCAVSCLWLKE